jgi:adenylate kinase
VAKKINTILMMGKTGSGKGVQATLLSKKTGFKIFSSGDRFRELRQGSGWLAARIREDYDRGFLMPPWLASFLFEQPLLEIPPAEGIIFEGSGRKKPEAELFNEVANWIRRDYLVFDLQVGDREVIERLKKRARDDGLDASLEKINLRLEEYRKYTVPAIAFFKGIGKVVEINGDQTKEAVHSDITKALGL